LEEIFQIAGLPNMNLLIPCDLAETKKATAAMIDQINGPCYIRFAREPTPIITSPSTPYKFGKATVIHYKGEQQKFADAFSHKLSTEVESSREDIAIISCGPEVAEAMRASWILKEEFNMTSRVVNLSTIKPLDKEAIVAAARECGCVLTVEEHQKGGMGNLVAAAILSSSHSPVIFDMMGVEDRFGETGAPWELIKRFGLSAEHIAQKARGMVGRKNKN
jgi:transketolase